MKLSWVLSQRNEIRGRVKSVKVRTGGRGFKPGRWHLFFLTSYSSESANQFSGGLATEKELHEWSGEIGSNVPFYFSNESAYCTGRGEMVLVIVVARLSVYCSLFVYTVKMSFNKVLKAQKDDHVPKLINIEDFYLNYLKTATKNFRPDSLLGEGGFDQVFKGWIDETAVAPDKPTELDFRYSLSHKSLETTSNQNFFVIGKNKFDLKTKHREVLQHL
ncbi:uncharacterized protein [Rutidosis leptorrhynchoides]|uniref:uncharacterized protein n=1 Tax=Rutidosis leptorrhynchoides TaxID=125765 RepID=UPI003A9924A0